MNPRAGISILVCSIGILTAQAQLTQEDSIRLKRMLEGKEEIIINQEAVKSIEFNFVPREELLRQRPMMAEDKPWMKFIKKLPKEFISVRKDTTDSGIRFKLNQEKLKPLPWLMHGYRVVPGGMDQTVTPSNNPIGGFDADKLLFETFTKRGRAIKRNRKRAKAWKTYNDSVPNQQDTLAGYENKKRIPQDTLHIKGSYKSFHKYKIYRKNQANKSC